MPRHRAPSANKIATSADGKSGKGPGKRGSRWNGEAGLKGHRREAILRSVANVLRNSALSSITMEDVADELGMTKGNLYYYFKDKQDILYQCHMRSMDISLRALEEALTKGRSPSEALRILLTGHVLGILEDGFGGILQTDFDYLRPDQRKRYVRKRDQLEQGVRRLIEDGIRSGEFECANVKLAGFAILGAINWLPKWYRPEGSLPAHEIADEMVNYFLRGLEARRGRAARPRPRQRGRHLETNVLPPIIAGLRI